MISSKEKILIAEIKKGNPKAFEDFFREFYNSLCVYSKLIVKRREIAEDIGEWENLVYADGFDKIFVASAPTERWNDILGKSITEITKNNN